MMVKDFIFKDGFIYIFNLFVKKWLVEIDINEKRSFCVFVFVVFFGGEINEIDFLSMLIGFFYERICIEYDFYLVKEENKEKQKFKIENLFENNKLDSEEILLMNNCCLKSCLY